MAISQLLAKKYGENVKIEYIDVTDSRLNEYPEVKKHVDNPSTPLPLVAFDDVPAWAGAVSFPHIVQELNIRGYQQKA